MGTREWRGHKGDRLRAAVSRPAEYVDVAGTVGTENDLLSRRRPLREYVDSWIEREPRLQGSVNFVYPDILVCPFFEGGDEYTPAVWG